MSGFVRFITDCADANAALRLGLQGEALFGVTPVVFRACCEIEAAGLLVDALDVAGSAEGIIFVNVAPRNGDAGKKWRNGVPFGYFRVAKTLIVTTIGAKTLSLTAKLGLAKTINVFDIPDVMSWGVQENVIGQTAADDICRTQFRSLFFAPRAGKWVSKGFTVPTKAESITGLVGDLQGKYFVWFVDCFGNVKTTFLSSEYESLRNRDNRKQSLLRLRSFPRLSDVPDDGDPAWVVGSSGYGENRFMELVVQGSSAAEKCGLQVGMPLNL